MGFIGMCLWEGYSFYYCYEKTIHVVLNQLCSSLWTSRFNMVFKQFTLGSESLGLD